MSLDDNYLAYFKFEGKLVQDGYFDAKKSAEALFSIDEMFRYFLYKNNPALSKLEFDFPVQIRKGSWETIIPANIGDFLNLILASGASAYAFSAMSKMAENDFENLGLKIICKNVIKSIKWIIQIGKHNKNLSVKTFENVKFKEKNGVKFVGILNDENKLLYVPKKYLELYTSTPESLLSRIAKLIEQERELKIGFSNNESGDIDDTENEVSIDYKDKPIFYTNEEAEDVLFPELIHGNYVELEGHITRGNENSNTIGFEYLNHILTCYPQKGNILRYQNNFFKDCLIKGYVDRLDKNNNYIEKRPKIRYLEIIDKNKTEYDLFNNS